jgi:hypothetical protein
MGRSAGSVASLGSPRLNSAKYPLQASGALGFDKNHAARPGASQHSYDCAGLRCLATSINSATDVLSGAEYFA